MVLIYFLIAAFLRGSYSADCSALSGSTITTVFFDPLKTLFNLREGLFTKAKSVLSTQDDASLYSFVDQWVKFYDDTAGNEFNVSIGKDPFLLVIDDGLIKVLSNLSWTLDAVQKNALLNAWGELTPYPLAIQTLQQLNFSGFRVGMLANANGATLTRLNDILIAANSPSMDYRFSSDFPSGSFLPNQKRFPPIVSATTLTDTQFLYVSGTPFDASGTRGLGVLTVLAVGQPDASQTNQPCFAYSDVSSIVPLLAEPSPTPSTTITPTASPTMSETPTPTSSISPTPSASPSIGISPGNSFPSALASFSPTPASSQSSSPSHLSPSHSHNPEGGEGGAGGAGTPTPAKSSGIDGGGVAGIIIAAIVFSGIVLVCVSPYAAGQFAKATLCLHSCLCKPPPDDNFNPHTFALEQTYSTPIKASSNPLTKRQYAAV